MNNKTLQQINKKLTILLNIFLEKRQKENNYSDEDQAYYLSEFALTHSEIATLIKKTSNAVGVLLHRQRKKRVGK